MIYQLPIYRSVMSCDHSGKSFLHHNFKEACFPSREAMSFLYSKVISRRQTQIYEGAPMQIVYDTRKDLPCEGLHDLFKALFKA